MDREDYDRLCEIHEQMNELLGEARQIMSNHGGIAYDRAEAYWLGHIDGALNNINPYDVTMEKALKSLEKNLESEDEDEDFEEEEEEDGEKN